MMMLTITEPAAGLIQPPKALNNNNNGFDIAEWCNADVLSGLKKYNLMCYEMNLLYQEMLMRLVTLR